MFLDESNFQVFQIGSTTVSPRSSDGFDPRWIIPTAKHAESVMVWQRFSGKMERAGLYFLPKDKKMNADAFAGTRIELLPHS